MFFGTVGYGQLKVVAPNGDTKIGNTAVAPAGKLHVEGGDVIFEGGNVGVGTTTPQHTLHVDEFNLTNTSLQVGGFGIQSFNPSQGQLIGNGYWESGVGPQVNVNGGFSMLHFFSGKVALRTQVNGTTGSTVILQNTLTADGNGNVGVGTLNAAHRLDVIGDAYKTQGGDLWNMPSDKRLKKNINNFTNGLDVIMDLNPKEYEYNGKGGTTDGEYQIGVMAQDLQKVAPWMVGKAKIINSHIDKNGEEIVDSEESILTINASSLKWLLVNAVQEQQKVIEQQDEELNELKKDIDKLKEILKGLASNQVTIETYDVAFTSESSLNQNIPNPFNKNTLFKFEVSESASKAQISIISMDGKIIKTIPVQNGKGQVNFDAQNLSAGMYNYHLIVDGNIIESKQMVIAK